jgi:fructokinase
MGRPHQVSDEDLAHLGLPGDTPVAQARALLQQTKAAWLALTCGAQGAYLLTRAGAQFQRQETRALEVADTVGAGDCFLAGLVARWLALGLDRDWGRAVVAEAEAQSLLDCAVASASINVQRRGCQPPTAQEVRDWLALP